MRAKQVLAEIMRNRQSSLAASMEQKDLQSQLPGLVSLTQTNRLRPAVLQEFERQSLERQKEPSLSSKAKYKSIEVTTQMKSQTTRMLSK